MNEKPINHALDVITFGEAMLLLVADQPGPLEHVERFHKRSAGAETNVAIGLSRLGLRVGWASRIGTDSMGRYLLDFMASQGIDCSHVVSDVTKALTFKVKVLRAMCQLFMLNVWLTPWAQATLLPLASSALC